MVTLGVLSPLLGGWYHGGVLAGVARATARHGGHVLAVQTVADLAPRTLEATSRNVDRGRAPDFVNPTAWEHLSGFVVIGAAAPTSYLNALRTAGKPFVVVGDFLPGLLGPVVAPDNRGGARLAVTHLIRHGHRRIAFAGFTDGPEIAQRYRGFLTALADNGVEHDPALVFAASANTEAAGRDVGRQMLAAGLPSTAVIAGSDVTAMGMIDALTNAGCELPADQAIIGFDDLEAGAYAVPRLSTISYSTVHCGEIAAEELLAILRGDGGVSGHRRLSVRLVSRESCGCSGTVALWSTQKGVPTRQESTQDSSFAHLGTAERRSDAVRQLLADRLLAMVTPWVTDRDELRQARDGLHAVAGVVTGGPVPSKKDLITTLERVVGLTGRPSTLLDLAEVVRSWREAPPAAADAMLFLIAGAHGRAKDQIATAVMRELRIQHSVSTELLRSHEADPHRLAWLAGTHTRIASLAVWTAGEPPIDPDPAENKRAILDVIGHFPVEEIEREQQLVLAKFPPMDLIQHSGSRPDEIASVIPVALGRSDWGLLAIISPIQLGVIDNGSDATNQCATLLTVALDDEQVLHDLRSQERELRAAAMHDHLTGLANRTLLLNKLRQAIRRNRTEEAHDYAVLYFDLDHFKNVNDTLGHAAGDEVLRQLAARMTELLRPSDTAARIGGDEFVILVDGLVGRDVPGIVHRLEHDLSRPIAVQDRHVAVGVSVGVTYSAAGHRDAEEVLREGDVAMYTVKTARRPKARASRPDAAW